MHVPLNFLKKSINLKIFDQSHPSKGKHSPVVHLAWGTVWIFWVMKVTPTAG